MDQAMTCPMCGAHVGSQEEMEEHGKMHKGEGGEGTLKCPMCGATFTSKEEMDKHAQESHNQGM